MEPGSVRQEDHGTKMPRIYISYDEEGYSEDLKKRLEEYGISHGELCRESGIDPGQMSRWFNTDREPRLESIVRLEQAVARIRRRMQKRKERSRDE